jgi:hypothetical protein
MTLPVVTQTWTIDPNHRITFVSVLDAMQQYAYGDAFSSGLPISSTINPDSLVVSP